MSYKDQVVAIAVKNIDGTTSVGTGFSISKNLIITAGHVVKNRSPGEEVRIYWDAVHGGETPKPHLVDENAIRWEGDGDLDAALIWCPRPSDREGFAAIQLAWTLPSGDLRWSSRGYPKASTRDGAPLAPSDFSGELALPSSQDRRCQLTVTDPPDNPGGWKGASGMPVICSKNRFWGVVGTALTNFGNKKLFMVPLHILYDEKGFRNSFEECEFDEKSFLEMRAELVCNALSSDGADGLCELLSFHYNLTSLEICKQAIAKSILASTPDALITDLHRIAKPASPHVRKIISEIITLALPALPNERTTMAAQMIHSDNEVSAVSLELSLWAAAEVAMARADRQSASFRANGRGDSIGHHALPLPPEGGRDQDGQQLVRDFIKQIRELTDEFGKDNSDVIKAIVDSPIFDDDRPYLSDSWCDEDISLINARIDNVIALDGRRPYFAFVPPKDSERRNAVLEGIQVLKQRNLNVVFLELSPDLGHRAADVKSYGNVPRILALCEQE